MPHYPDRLGARVEHALDLAHDGITLYRRQTPGQWAEIGHAPLQVGSLGQNLTRLATLVRGIGVEGPAHVQVWLPEDQVIVRDVPGAPDRAAIASAFASSTSQPADKLVFDTDAGGEANPQIVAAIPAAVLSESLDFLSPHGFTITHFTTRDAPNGLPSAPVFRMATKRADKAAFPIVPTAAAAAALLIAIGAGYGVSQYLDAEQTELSTTTGVQQIVLAPDQGLPLASQPVELAGIGRPGLPDGLPSVTSTVEGLPEFARSLPMAAALTSVADLPSPAEIPMAYLPSVLSVPAKADALSGPDLIGMTQGPTIFTAAIQTRMVPSLGSIEIRNAYIGLDIGRESIVPARFAVDQVFAPTSDPTSPRIDTSRPEPVVTPTVEIAALTDRFMSDIGAEELAPRLPAPESATTNARLSPQEPLATSPADDATPETATTDAPPAGERVTPERVRVIPDQPVVVPPSRDGAQAGPVELVAVEAPTEFITDTRVRIIARAPVVTPPLRPVDLNVPAGSQMVVTGDGVKLTAVEVTEIPVNAVLVGQTADTSVTDSRVRIIAAEPAVIPPARDGTDAESSFVKRGTNPRVVVLAALPDIVPMPRPGSARREPGQAILDVIENGKPLQDAPNPAADHIAALVLRAQEDALTPSPNALKAQEPPRKRPTSLVTAARQAEEERVAALTPSEIALERSAAPRHRPSGLLPPAPDLRQQRAAVAATVRPAEPVRDRSKAAAPAPALPTSASVARAATVDNALPLRQMSLLGVFGRSSRRHALMRLPNGRTVKVAVGDTVDGYSVAAISEDAIRIRRGGRDTVLVIPE